MYKLISILFLLISPPDELQVGINYFKARSENSIGLQANSVNVDKAIAIFELQLKENKNVMVAGGYLLQCWNFKGRFVYISDDEKKIAYSKTIEIGNELIKKYPKDGKIRFELVSAIALKAEINGIMKSMDDGVLNKMIYHTKMLMATDSTYNCGSGWKFDAGLNYKTPYIPLVITWPDKDKAVATMKKVIGMYPADVGANFYYAEALYENDQKKLAKIYFELATKLPSRRDYQMEDEFFKVKSKKYLAKL